MKLGIHLKSFLKFLFFFLHSFCCWSPAGPKRLIIDLILWSYGNIENINSKKLFFFSQKYFNEALNAPFVCLCPAFRTKPALDFTRFGHRSRVSNSGFLFCTNNCSLITSFWKMSVQFCGPHSQAEARSGLLQGSLGWDTCRPVSWVQVQPLNWIIYIIKSLNVSIKSYLSSETHKRCCIIIVGWKKA